MTALQEIHTTRQDEMTAPAPPNEISKPGMAPSATHIPPARGWLAMLVTVVVLASLFAIAMLPRWRANAALQNAARDQRPTVSVVSPERPGAEAGLVLPGSTQAIQETTINARANGYVGKWFVDIGDKVKPGQVLAVLETPELDQQLETARGNLRQSQANFELARVTAQRWQELARKLVVSKQDNDTQQSNYQAATATLTANKATVAQYEALQAFNNVTAPFAGIITARYIDNGTLVAAGSTGKNGALFHIAQTDPLRIFVSVPQTDALLIRYGQIAAVSFTEIPDKTFPATVVRTSGAIDPASRTLLTELHVPNADGQLLPGMYAEIRFTLPLDRRTLLIPGNAVMIRSDGAKVMIVDAQHVIRYRPVKLGRDLGEKIEILSGLGAGDSLIANPSDAFREGLEVKVQSPPPAKL